MSKISNIITMLQLLNSGKKYSIKELSENLEVTERMIRVYKNDLEKSGIYIDTLMGPYGGYILRRQVKIPLSKFSDEDYKILDNYIKNENDSNLKNSLVNLQDKIKNINNYKKINLSNDETKKYNILNKAIKEKRKVKILYYSYNEGEKERIIDPAELFLFEDGWYVAAFCELRNDIRHFELKRIIKYELLNELYK